MLPFAHRNLQRNSPKKCHFALLIIKKSTPAVCSGLRLFLRRPKARPMLLEETVFLEVGGKVSWVDLDNETIVSSTDNVTWTDSEQNSWTVSQSISALALSELLHMNNLKCHCLLWYAPAAGQCFWNYHHHSCSNEFQGFYLEYHVCCHHIPGYLLNILKHGLL